MKYTPIRPKQSLNKAYLKEKPLRADIDKFKLNLIGLLEKININESEENAKNNVRDFLLNTYYKGKYEINTKDRNDLVIHIGKDAKYPVGVIIEAKRPSEKHGMLSKSNLNVKAFQELVLYYLRERIDNNNTSITKLIATNGFEWFIFRGNDFYRLFYQNPKLRKQYIEWRDGQKDSRKTYLFYTDIAKTFIKNCDEEILYTYFNLQNYTKVLHHQDKKDDNKLISLYKVLSPQHLLNLPFANDSNSLNKKFYSELLHIIGLYEFKKSGKKLIARRKPKERNSGSLLENTIAQLEKRDKVSRIQNPLNYGKTQEERLFRVALELCITWINRIMFLKLLESQLRSYHKSDDSDFLNIQTVKDFDDLDDLFFSVLAQRIEDRKPEVIEKFGDIPYLNSSLFEPTDLEHETLFISNLEDDKELPMTSTTVFKNAGGSKLSGKKPTLEYLFDFLNAYDFNSEGKEDIQDDSRTLINASVLGLIFEKINGYKDGSFFTPGFITMFMARQTLQRTITQKFSAHSKYSHVQSFESLVDQIDTSKEGRKEANTIINSIRICDPAVGSGHFLVSCLNEMIFIKSELGVLNYNDGSRIKNYKVEVNNDELTLYDEEADEIFDYTVQLNDGKRTVSSEKQALQMAIFHEKQTIIENCLFGVDININSVKICRLRLWIELLKNAYYKSSTNFDYLETLPNIDINIKQGNSLISRFDLNADLKHALRKSKWNIESYRLAVSSYRNAQNKDEKRSLEKLIDVIKNDFKTEINQNSKEVRILKKWSGDLINLTTQTRLFELDKKGKKDFNDNVKTLTDKIRIQEKLIEEIKQNKIYENAFEWRFEFPEVLDDEGNFVGFDTVIANPPYMRVQEIQKTQPQSKQFYKQIFNNAKSSYDLANLFFELAVNISNSKAHNSFIFPHKFFNSASTKVFRDYLTEGKYIDKISHFGANMIFEDADTYTCVAQFSKFPNEGFLFQRFPYKSDFKTNLWIENKYRFTPYQQIKEASKLYGGNQWILFDDQTGFEVFKQIYKNSNLFESLFEGIFQGIATSKDDLYILELKEETPDTYILQMNCKFKEEIIERKYEVEKFLFKPFLMGKDVHRYDNLSTNKYVFFPYDIEMEKPEPVMLDRLKKEFPLTFEYVQQNAEIFKSRESGKAARIKPWYAYIYPKNLNKFEQEKLSSMEICALYPNVTYNTQNFYHTTKVYSWVKHKKVKKSYEYLLAIANSKVLWWFLKMTGDTLQGDARTFKTNYLNPFPIPKQVDSGLEKRLVDMVKETLDKKLNGENTETIEAEIDDFVFKLYGLSPEHIDEIKARQ